MFTRQKTQIRGAFATDSGVMTVSGTNLGIVQNVQLQVGRQYNRIYNLAQETQGVVDAYLVGGRVQGNGQLGRILGPKSDGIKDFYAKMANECTLQDLNFAFQAGHCGIGAAADTGGGQQKLTYGAKQCTMTGANIGTSADSFLINENVQLIFADLELT